MQETTGEGVVFVPAGPLPPDQDALRLARHPPDRLRDRRPVFVLGENTPGYQDPDNENYMVFFAGGRPAARDAAAAHGWPAA